MAEFILSSYNTTLCLSAGTVVSLDKCGTSKEKQLVKGKLEPLRSQRARMTVLAHKEFLKGGKTPFYPIAWQSTIVKRVCRSKLQAESYGMTAAVEEGMRLRAMITGQGKVGSILEAEHAAFMADRLLESRRSFVE